MPIYGVEDYAIKKKLDFFFLREKKFTCLISIKCVHALEELDLCCDAIALQMMQQKFPKHIIAILFDVSIKAFPQFGKKEARYDNKIEISFLLRNSLYNWSSSVVM